MMKTKKRNNLVIIEEEMIKKEMKERGIEDQEADQKKIEKEKNKKRKMFPLTIESDENIEETIKKNLLNIIENN